MMIIFKSSKDFGFSSFILFDFNFIFKYLHSTAACFDLYNYLSFKINDKPSPKFDLKIKKALHIHGRKPNLNIHKNHLALTLLLKLASYICSFLSLFFVFLFHLLFSLSLKLIIGIFFYHTVLLHHYFISL